MDQIRQVRVLIPPIICLLSLLWGAYLDPDKNNLLRRLFADQNKMSVLLASGGAAVLAGGVVIGAVTNVSLRFFTDILFPIFFWFAKWLRSKRYVAGFYGNLDAFLKLRDRCLHWEIGLPKSYFDNITDKLSVQVLETDRARFRYYEAVTFDHENLKKDAPGVHDWIVRHWNWFNVMANSCTGLLLSLVIATPLCIDFNARWLGTVAILFSVLLANAVIAWHETTTMSLFQSSRTKRAGSGEATSETAKQLSSSGEGG